MGTNESLRERVEPECEKAVLEDLEEEVLDAILQEDSDDLSLTILIRLAKEDMERPIFQNPLYEPTMWMLFKKWVRSGLSQLSAFHKSKEQDET